MNLITFAVISAHHQRPDTYIIKFNPEERFGETSNNIDDKATSLNQL